MEIGSIAKWLKKEGDKVIAGEAIADIQTDKASVTFEAVDDVFIAKILAQEGVDIPVGTPIMVTVDDDSLIAKFANYSPAVPKAQNVAPPLPKETVSTPPAPSPPSVPVTPPVLPPSKTSSANAKATVATAVPPVESKKPIPPPTTAKPDVVKSNGVSKGALFAKLSADQLEYVKKYGSSGHIPLL